MSAPRTAVVPHRWACSRVLTLGLAALLVMAGGLRLFAALYYDAARHSGALGDFHRAGLASGFATRIGEPSATPYAGRLAALDGDQAVVLERYRRAVRDAPSDGYRWAELAQSLALAGDFGERLDQAVQQAQRLAPRSQAVNLALADLRWRYGGLLTPEQQLVLEPNLGRALKDLSQRPLLLERIVRARRQTAFCAEYGLRFTGGRWCQSIDADLARCAQPQRLERERQQWCRRVEAP